MKVNRENRSQKPVSYIYENEAPETMRIYDDVNDLSGTNMISDSD